MRTTNSIRAFFKKSALLLLVAAVCAVAAFLINLSWAPGTSLHSAHSKINSLVKESEQDFIKLTADTSFTKQALSGTLSAAAVEKLNNKRYYLFFYSHEQGDESKLRTWSSQAVLPPTNLLYSNTSTGFLRWQNAYYAWNRKPIDGGIAIAMIPVKWNYFVTNDYLRNDFTVKGIRPDIILLNPPTDTLGLAVHSISGEHLFSINKTDEVLPGRTNPVSIILYLVAAIMLLLFIHSFALFICRKKGVGWGLVFFFGIIVLLRVITYNLPLPVNLRQFELFDPSVYGSTSILPSLGDLLINSLIFLWFAVFLRGRIRQADLAFTTRNKYMPYAWLVLISAVIVAVTFICASAIRSLVADSQISFDVINFFTLNIYSIFGFLILCCIAIGYFLLCQVLVDVLKPFLNSKIIPLLFSITIVGLMYLSAKIGQLSGGLELYILLWLLFFVFLLQSNFLQLLISQIITSRLVFWLFFFSVSITALIIIENHSKELRQREHYSGILATKADPTSETLLNTMLTGFREGFLADHFHRFLSRSSNHSFKDSLIEANFLGYTDRYETHLFTFDADEQPLYNKDSIGFNDLNTIFTTQARPTGIANLYYYDVSYDRFSYISKKYLRTHDGVLQGYLFIIANPKQTREATLYPELFNRGHANAIENSSRYAFGIYSNHILVSSHNDYPFSTNIHHRKFPPQQVFGIQQDDHHELWYNAGGGRIVVIVKSNSYAIEFITLFSYLFCGFLLLTFAISILSSLFNSRLSLHKLKQIWQPTLRTQIHGTIIFICVIAFLVIGAATILFFINRYENLNRERLSKTIRVMENELKSTFALKDTAASRTIFNAQRKEALERAIRRVSEIHTTDVNLYDLTGHLQVSSLPLPYSKGIVSTQMNPVAYHHLHQNKEVQYFQQEQIGRLQFISNYKPLMDNQGNKHAYLNIPYFTSQTNLKEEISNFLVTIINLNAFIFLIAGVLALFITNRITQTLSLIGEKMKRINLGGHNEAIHWNRKDEIGELVSEYNKMVLKLEESAAALARSEREEAWREMAKQIAHEIKNPLTPMKLSIQYLQKALDQDAPNIRELSEQVSQTLVDQIDHLSMIASEFSQFANIENAQKDDVQLNEVLQMVTNLYRMNEEVDLEEYLLPGPLWVVADKSHLNRIFTNLFQNAIQAVEPGKRPMIKIEQHVVNRTIVTSISDNGTGIEPELRERIFMPNFTTKSSGAGLGLAMSKRMVEHAGGKIWFQSVAHNGTTFFVQLPLKPMGEMLYGDAEESS